MVFSRELMQVRDGLGIGLAVPFTRPTLNAKELFDEAEWLWTAEQKAPTRKTMVSASWGCTALLLNPLGAPGNQWVADAWANRMFKEPHHGSLPCAGEEGSVILKSGLLDIRWPADLQGAPLHLDFVLATATAPTLHEGKYPSADAIARAWKSGAGVEYVDYFWRNREHGIETRDDEVLMRLLAS